MKAIFQRGGRAAGALAAAVCVLALGGSARAAQLPQMPANQYVRGVVQREMAARGSHAYMFRLRRETPKGTEIREMVQTRDGIVARVVARNDQPLSAEDRKKDDERLRKLLSDTRAQEERRREQQQDEERAKKLIRSLPDAFNYEYDGLEPAKTGPQVRLRFSPNPDFEPPSRETLIFKQMVGTMWVDAAGQRIARLDASLTEDVSIGWGIIGRLNRGGRFFMEQTKLDETWVISRMSLDFTGRALLFKKLVIRQTQSTYDFKRVPSGLTLAQGVELLRKEAQAPNVSAAR
jgi:hypothetical protein